MIKQMLACIFLFSPAIAGGSPAIAGGTGAPNSEFGTLTEAKAMLVRAATAIQTDQSGAIAKFNHNDPEFRDRDLFVFCFNGQDGKFTAHEAMITRDVRTFRDVNGIPYGQLMYNVATEGQINDVAYVSSFPGSTEQVAKRALITRIGDQVCGVSAYRFDR